MKMSMGSRIAIVITSLSSAVGVPACRGGPCPQQHTPLDQVCVEQKVASFVGCIRGRAAELTEDKGTELSMEAGYLGVSAGAAVDVRDELKKKYGAASDANERVIIDYCYTLVTGSSPAAPTIPPVEAPAVSLPKNGEACLTATGCSPGLSCVERHTDLPGELQTIQGPSTGQRGQFAAEDATFDAGGDCPQDTRREGAPVGSGSSSTTCEISWVSDNPLDCRVRVHRSHGLGKWHCNTSYTVRQFSKKPSGFYCQ